MCGANSCVYEISIAIVYRQLFNQHTQSHKTPCSNVRSQPNMRACVHHTPHLPHNRVMTDKFHESKYPFGSSPKGLKSTESNIHPPRGQGSSDVEGSTGGKCARINTHKDETYYPINTHVHACMYVRVHSYNSTSQKAPLIHLREISRTPSTERRRRGRRTVQKPKQTAPCQESQKMNPLS